MKKMKFSMKALMAMLLFCLPLAMTSCGSDDDDDNGPKTYSYNWELKDANSGSTTAEQQANLAEQAKVNQLLATAFSAKGASSNATQQTFSFTGTKSADSYDNDVKAAFYSVKSDIIGKSIDLPNSTKVVIKRGSKQIVSEKLF